MKRTLSIFLTLVLMLTLAACGSTAGQGGDSSSPAPEGGILASTIVIRFVLSVILGIWMDLGVIGVAAAMCCDWMVRAVLFLRRFNSGKWKEFQVIDEKENTL